jgi:hypothetical protein
LVPVELIKEPKRDVYKISILAEDIVISPTLSLKLKQTFGIDLPEGEVIQEITYSELIIQRGDQKTDCFSDRSLNDSPDRAFEDFPKSS